MTHKATDPVLLALSGLLAASIAAFLLGYIPYPFGLIVLGFFIVARVLSLKAKAGKSRKRGSGCR